MSKYKFILEKKDKKARSGTIKTSLGKIKTPAFMPVATQGAIKSTPINIIEEIGYDMILSNTYHNILRPGLKIIKEFNSDDNFLLLAWILPNLFFLELIPTKLPHYSLPIYPALAL